MPKKTSDNQILFYNLVMGDKIGALWNNRSKGKTAFLSGVINAGLLGQKRVVVFKNELKEKDNEPDYHILLSEPARPQDDKPSETYDEFIA